MSLGHPSCLHQESKYDEAFNRMEKMAQKWEEALKFGFWSDILFSQT